MPVRTASDPVFPSEYAHRNTGSASRSGTEWRQVRIMSFPSATLSEYATRVTSERWRLGNSERGDWVTRQFTQRQFTPRQFTQRQFTPRQFTPRQITPRQFTLRQLTPPQFTPRQLTPRQFSTQICIPLTLANKMACRSHMTLSYLVNQKYWKWNVENRHK